jgi:SRSO17 transposase
VAYGCDGTFRAGVTALGLPYAVGAQSTLTLWPPGEEPLPSKPWSGRGASLRACDTTPIIGRFRSKSL